MYEHTSSLLINHSTYTPSITHPTDMIGFLFIMQPFVQKNTVLIFTQNNLSIKKQVLDIINEMILI